MYSTKKTTKKLGGFSKAITVISNAKKARKMLKIKGFITKKAPKAKDSE